VSEAPDTRSAVAGGGDRLARGRDGNEARREVADARESFTSETGIEGGADAAGTRDSFAGDTEEGARHSGGAPGEDGSAGDGQPIEEFGPYVVYERVGQGGMATVHRAEKRGIGFRRPVALKRLFPHVAADPELVKLFVDEARLASHLHHGNIAQTYELGRVGDTYFIAMEYASGPTLGQIVRQCQQAALDIPITITVSILTQVCDALDYAHNLCDESGRSLRIIHRDVSPANIIVSGTGIVKLIDFGIAKATTSTVKTQTGFIKGKFGYIAPEYITGKIDARVDVFALGVIAHELLAGKRLFEGKDDFETMANIRDMVVSPPSRWNAHVPPHLDDIVMTALERDPARRWQSAAAMQHALATAARELGVVVGSQQLVEWVAWAFEQIPADTDPLARPESHTDETNAFGKSFRLAGGPGSSLSIEVEVDVASGEIEATADALDVSTMPGSRRAVSAADSDDTVALERVAMASGDRDAETPPPRTPAPVIPVPGTPVLTPTIPTWAVSPSGDAIAAFPTPTPIRLSSIEAAAPPLSRAARPALPFGKTAPGTPAPPRGTSPPPISAHLAIPTPVTSPRSPSSPARTSAPPAQPSRPPATSTRSSSSRVKSARALAQPSGPAAAPPRSSSSRAKGSAAPAKPSRPPTSTRRSITVETAVPPPPPPAPPLPPMQAEPAASAPHPVLPSPVPSPSVPSSPIPLVPAPPAPRTGARASRQLDAELPAVASSRDVDVIAAPADHMFENEIPEVTEPVRPKLKPRSKAKATLRTRPQAGPVPRPGGEPSPGGAPGTDRNARNARDAAPRRRGATGLILLILALGCAAMAAAYFWPDL
jgi:serine/threonine protein kinase